MKEAIIDQSGRKQDTVIHVGFPVHVRREVHRNGSDSRFDTADDRQPWMRCPLERHCTPRSCEIPEDFKSNLIVAGP